MCPGNEGTLLNVSEGGLSVESSLGVRVGARYHLRWWTAGYVRTVIAIVRWSRLSATRRCAHGDVAPVFLSGFELVEPESTSDGGQLPRVRIAHLDSAGEVLTPPSGHLPGDLL